MKTFSLSVVIPVYNNSQSIKILNEKIMNIIQNNLVNTTFEIVYVDDGSTDDSWRLIEKIVNENRINVRGIKLAKNYTQTIATFAGIEKSSNEVVICMSADLQDPPELISNMIDEYRSREVDIVIAYREKRNDSRISKFLSQIAYYLVRSESVEVPRGGFDFYLINKKVKEIILQTKVRNRFLQSEILNTGLKYYSVGYERQKRRYGRSGYSLQKKFRVMIDILLNETSIISKLIAKTILLIISIHTILIILVSQIFSESHSLTNRIQFSFAIGVILWLIVTLQILVVLTSRIYEEQKNRPKYVISKEI